MNLIHPIHVVRDEKDRIGIVLKIETYHQTGNCTDISTHYKIVVINDENNIQLQCAFLDSKMNCYYSDFREKWYIEKEI